MKIRALEQASGGHWIKQNKQVGKKYAAQIPANKNKKPREKEEAIALELGRDKR